jgi:hypothetical protein
VKYEKLMEEFLVDPQIRKSTSDTSRETIGQVEIEARVGLKFSSNFLGDDKIEVMHSFSKSTVLILKLRS